MLAIFGGLGGRIILPEFGLGEGLDDYLVSFGMFDLLVEQLVGDSELILLSDVRQQFHVLRALVLGGFGSAVDAFVGGVWAVGGVGSGLKISEVFLVVHYIRNVIFQKQNAANKFPGILFANLVAYPQNQPAKLPKNVVKRFLGNTREYATNVLLFIDYKRIIQKYMSVSASSLTKKTFKIVLLGDSSTGKTSIIDRYVNNKFEPKDSPTIGIDFLGKNVSHQTLAIRLQLWDTAGQQRYRSLIPTYLKDAICAIFVFDLSRATTLSNLQSWIELFRNNRSEKTFMVMCGNKRDSIEEISSEMQQQINKIAKTHSMVFFEASALNGHNIGVMFTSIIEQIIALHDKKKRAIEEEMDGPLTRDPILSARKPTQEQSEAQKQKQDDRIKIKRVGEKDSKYCCMA